MKKLFILVCVILLSTACVSSPPTQNYVRSTNTKSVPAELEWKPGEKVRLTGTIWPSRAYTKYYIDTVDGKSAHLKSNVVDKLEAGTKVFLTGTVEYLNTVGTAGASDVRHSQTYFFVNVKSCKVLDETE